MCRHGLLEIWRTKQGRLVLLCDECTTAWFDPESVTEEGAVFPTADTFELPGDVIERFATADEIEAGGWSGYVESS